jgi:AraC-like DNA-binding protein
MPRRSGKSGGFGRGLVESGMVRVGPIMALPSVLREFGVMPSAVLSEFRLPVAFFDDPENTLPMALAGKLLARCVERTGCEYFGLLVGQHAGASSLGALGFLILSSPTVGDALDAFERQLQVQDRGGTVWVDVDRGFASLGYTLLDRDIVSIDQILQCALAIAANTLRSLCGAQWRPHEVLFAFSRPRRVDAFRRFFGVRPRFDADRTCIVLPSRLLQTAIPSSDFLLHKLMEERVRELLSTNGDDFVGRVRHLLSVMVTTPDCSARTVASRIGLHVRTFNRKLAATGTTFIALRDEARQALACQLLRSTVTTAGEVASVLGYTDPASFTRAFRRWTGTSPAQWRARERSQRAVQERTSRR